MSGKYLDHFGNPYEDVKENNIKFNLNKHEYDLYHEEDDIPGSVVQVKKFGNSKKGEKWKILKDGKAVLTIDGSKLTLKEREALYTPEGINFLIKQFKSGCSMAITSLKKQIKTLLK